MKKIFLVLIAMVFVVACESGELTRSKAKSIIEKSPEALLIPFRAGTHSIYLQIADDDRQIFIELEQGGYITIKRGPRDRLAFTPTEQWDIIPTNQLKPFMTNDGFFGTPCLIAGHYVADKITGIKKDPGGNSCSVDCVSKFVPNELTEIMHVSDSQKKPKHDECILVKYDDGWRYTQRGMWIFK